MANQSAKATPSSAGSRTAVQPKSATEGAAGRTVTNSRAEAGRFVPTDLAKKVLERHGNDPNKALEHAANLEAEHTRTRQQLARMQEQLQKLQGLSEFVEQNPITGQIQLKKDFKAEIAAGGSSEIDAKKAFSEQLVQALNNKESNPSTAFVDMMWNVAKAVAKNEVGGVNSKVDTMSANTQLGLYIIDNPEYIPLAEHIKGWLARQPEQVRQSISMDEVVVIVKNRLEKAGQLEATGYRELSEEERASIRNRTSFTGGGSATAGADTAPNQEEEDRNLKEAIKNSPTGYDKFLRNSRTRSLGKDPTQEIGDI